jgi:hypothetical protein
LFSTKPAPQSSTVPGVQLSPALPPLLELDEELLLDELEELLDELEELLDELLELLLDEPAQPG